MNAPVDDYAQPSPEQKSPIGRLLRFCLTNKVLVGLVVVLVIGWGVMVAPFDWELWGLPRSPVPTDAIPDVGENQQIVFTNWPGRSPQDVQDQITYPLASALWGIKGVKTIRSQSFFGFSSIYVIFEERVDFYWARSRVQEKVKSLPAGNLPEGVQPRLGPEATALGQVFWYTLEGRDDLDGNPIGGWDLEELRTIQDWYVRYALMSARGVGEVASVGGFVREYQVDVDPDAMRAYGVTLPQISAAVKASNIDVGAKTIELNQVEYFVRGVGFIKSVEDIASSVIKVNEDVPICVKHVATVTLGPALRRGALNKDGAEAVGGVVVARYGANPLAVIKSVKKKIEQISPGLPAKVVIDWNRVSPDEVRSFARAAGFEAYQSAQLDHQGWVQYLRKAPRQSWPDWANISQLTIVPFYDRTGLIYETLGTLNDALAQEILITFIVVIIMVMHLRSSLIIGSMLPLAVLLCFIAMKTFGVDANIVALSGIAIAIGTIVDMGIVISENILRHLDRAPPEVPRLEVVHRAASEVGGAVLTAVATTVVSFLPVFAMTGPEGKLFRPLALTKTFALIASIVIALTVVPPAAHILLGGRISGRKLRAGLYGVLAAAGVALAGYGVAAGSFLIAAAGVAVAMLGVFSMFQDRIPPRLAKLAPWAASVVVVLLVGLLLSEYWEPLGPQRGLARNFIFVAVLVGVLLGLFKLFQLGYPRMLRWCLAHKLLFLSLPTAVVILAAVIWLGFPTVFGWVPAAAEKVGADPQTVRHTNFWVAGSEKFPGLGKEFMPPLDEGSYLYMPVTMIHASIGEAMDVLGKQGVAFANIPEVESAVGKIGRAQTPLDPAPVSMIETVINYKPEYITDKAGRRVKFKYDRAKARFVLDASGRLIHDSAGRPYRQWRDHIKTPDDIWREIVQAGQSPSITRPSKLQPIMARIVMLQSGIRAPLAVRIWGPSLEAIERAGGQIERLLKQVSSVDPDTVAADQVVRKPYWEIAPPRRQAMERHGARMEQFQGIVETALGGRKVTTTVEGPRRFGVRVRYQRELRDTPESMERILIPGSGGAQIPLIELADVRYVRGPQVIKTEDAFLTSYVLFGMKPGQAEVDVVEQCRRHLRAKIDSGELILPPGVYHEFAGTYESHVRSQRKLAWVLPLALFLIFMILYLQLRSASTTVLVFFGVFVAWAGGFLLLWLYGRPWFLDFSVFGVNMRELFAVHPINLSVAVWVGFLALFGIATDNGVIQSTYLNQVFRQRRPATVEAIREATVAAAVRRARPCLMTSATTILALIPVLTSTGRGSDVMVPMAIPSFGGMLVVLLSIFMVPVLYCAVREYCSRRPGGPPRET